MEPLNADDLRTRYIAFFEARGHARIPSAPLIPENDPSVLFTTAGMHPLVPYLLGQPHPAGRRLVDVQKCVRTTDIEEVGDDTHLTLFEMLGNWSLGSYFKDESIPWSFEFLTSDDCLGYDPDDLWVSVFAGAEGVPRDDESAKLWAEVGIPSERIVFLGPEHNWWAVGAEGPCGPDTEIFFDRTHEPCDAGAECLPSACECGRFVEIWNNVFMTFERRDGQLKPLPERNVDTGMGLERTLVNLQQVSNVYETAPLSSLVDAVIDVSGFDRGTIVERPDLTRACRILVDHLRAAVFILGDSVPVAPSNQGPGYVLRRLIRRGMRYCVDLQVPSRAWIDLAPDVVRLYGGSYPEMEANRERIADELAREHDRFGRTLDRGTVRLERALDRLAEHGATTLPGDVAFHLYDTYGFPIEFTSELAGARGVAVDRADFLDRLEQHRERSRGAAAASGLADDSAESVRYHTATHLLHAALRSVLGDHVEQRGSNITRERLRFDFSHPAKMTPEEIGAVEGIVQQQIDAHIAVSRSEMSQAEARARGAIGLFDERYSGDVSVYQIGDFSMEFCGGPHVSNTDELGKFKITKEQSSGAGVRRIRAVLQ